MAKNTRSKDRPDELAAVSALGEPTRRASSTSTSPGPGRGSVVTRQPRPSGSSAAPWPFTWIVWPEMVCSRSITSGVQVGRVLVPAGRRSFIAAPAAILEVNLPPRDYRLAGRLLADAAVRSSTERDRHHGVRCQGSGGGGSPARRGAGAQLRGASGRRTSRRSGRSSMRSRTAASSRGPDLTEPSSSATVPSISSRKSTLTSSAA